MSLCGAILAVLLEVRAALNAGPQRLSGRAILGPLHCAVDNTPSLPVHGVQEYHRIVCEAVGIDQAWYQGAATGQNSPPWTTPP